MLKTFYEKSRAGIDHEVFRVRGYAPGLHIGGAGHALVAMESLPPFLRTLLVTDGTVTKALEAYHWEPVQVVAVTQRVVEAEAAIEWLGVQAGESVLARCVRLLGDRSRRHYANAFSIIRLDPIPERLRSRLLGGTIGIGELIRDCGLETYRELLELGTTDDLSLGGEYDDAPQDCVFRTYRITLGGQPSLLVTECFPLGSYTG